MHLFPYMSYVVTCFVEFLGWGRHLDNECMLGQRSQNATSSAYVAGGIPILARALARMRTSQQLVVACSVHLLSLRAID